MAWLWLAALLTPVSGLVQRDQDPDPPIKNLRMEPRNKRLTWDVTGNVSQILCSNFRLAKKNLYCTYHVLHQCKATNYTVNVTTVDGQRFSTWIQYPKQDGNPRAAPTHLRCLVHDKDFLTCSWAAGPEAPSGVQYSFHLEDINTTEKWPCPKYTSNGRGQRVQCRFENLSAFPDHQYRFLVSSPSTPCSELISFLSDMERLIAPNITATCNRSLADLQWEMASHFHRAFEYQLEIQQESGVPFTQNVSLDKSFTLTNPGTFTVRIRAWASAKLIGPWSAPQRFACEPRQGAHLPVWLTSSLTALVTLLTVGSAVLLCKRYSVLETLFPPIPHLKDPLGGNFQSEKMLAWGPGGPPQEECPVAEVQVLREA